MTIRCRAARLGAASVALLLGVALCSPPAVAESHRPSSSSSSSSFDRGLAALGGLPLPDPNALVVWVTKEIGGALLPPPASKAFAFILDIAAGGKKSDPLEQMNNKLNEIKSSLDQLHQKVDQVLKEVTEAQFLTAMQDVRRLEGNIWEAQNQFKIVLDNAGNPDKKALVENSINNIKGLVNGPGGLAASYSVIPGAIYRTGTSPKPAYEIFSNLATDNNKALLTWRTSAGIQNFFQYLLNLQSMQFNLIVQVRALEGNDPDSIYATYGKPYLGDRASLAAIIKDKVPVPSSGSLHDALVTGLQEVPAGAVVDTRSRVEWSTDIPGGARDLTLQRSGPGAPTCTSPPPVACVTDPHYSLGPTQPAWTPPRWPDSPAAQLAKNLAGRGYGPAEGWDVPTPDQLSTLFTDYQSTQGSAKTWLEKRSGTANPAGCKPVTAGGDVAVKDSDSCIWPAADLWPTPSPQLTKDVYACHGSGLSYRCDVLRWRFPYGWPYPFLSTTQGSTRTCELVTEKLTWPNDGDFSPPSGEWRPQGSASCSGALVMVHKLTNERYYFPT